MKTRSSSMAMAVLAAMALGACGGPDDAPNPNGTGDPAAQVGPPAGQRSCAEVWDCYKACADEPCVFACQASGTALAQAQDRAFRACVADHGCQDVACLRAACPEGLEACIDLGVQTDVQPEPQTEPRTEPQPESEPQTEPQTESSEPSTGNGSFQCYAEATVVVCYQEAPACTQELVSWDGFGASEAEARVQALALCQKDVDSWLSVGNAYGHAGVTSRCAVMDCWGD